MRLQTLLMTAALALSLGGCGAADPAPAKSADPQVGAAGASVATLYSQGWLSVETVGNGPDVILLPGLSSASTVWDATVAALKDDYRLHRVDIAGFAGQQTGEPRDDIIAGLADDLATYIDTQSGNAPILIGHSMGGFTALHVSRDLGDRVRAAVIVDSLPFYPLILDPNATADSVRPQAEAMIAQMRALPKPAYDAMQAQMVTRLSKNTAAQTRIAQWSAESDRDVVLDAMAELMMTDMRPQLADIVPPITVIYAHDPLMGLPPETVDALYASAYSGVPQLTLTRVDESFHFIMDDQPDAFLTALRQALSHHEQ
ncbi:alpha/beta fold hydrolase [Algimonas porphyrae]|uniref:Alpha/beta hydrolase n=1 Tax=Algimonas porphyrae TaxID=1128113 RepID=A0ABQ5UZJ7_9PROT|nr:alpha/beta hydrolase [Algimonas porphyrae]GLQ20626.1 alpha/beta hydrolase [Algimonas porphyrae]